MDVSVSVQNLSPRNFQQLLKLLDGQAGVSFSISNNEGTTLPVPKEKLSSFRKGLLLNN